MTIRERLQRVEDERITVIGIVKNYGRTADEFGSSLTIHLVDLRDEQGNKLLNNQWFNYTKGFRETGLCINDRIRLNARVTRYKGRRGKIWYGLKNPTKIELVKEEKTIILRKKKLMPKRIR
jgi:hypothetical protein